MRMIDADALYETLCHIWDRSDSEKFEQAVFESIANAPTVEVPTWISCSDRLPEEDGYYLVSEDDGNIEVEWYDNTGWGYCGVIAWMPLPQPYRAESEE